MILPIDRFVLVLCCAVSATAAGQRLPAALLEKDSLRLVITDSGLGGLAVAAEIDSLERTTNRYRFLDIVFCNALPESDYGYNSMTTAEEQATVFSAALHDMTRRFRPDAILIACNTLSVVYPRTEFSTSGTIPVVDIVGIGVEMMEERLDTDGETVALLFGTETTVRSGDHIRALNRSGISKDRLIPQSCGELASEIQLDARSDMVSTMIAMYVHEAISTIQVEGRKVIAGLFCTHYGYRSEAFAQALTASGALSVEVLDPNHRMSRLPFETDRPRSFADSRTNIHVYSRATLSPEEIASISTLVRPVSPGAADALASYTLQEDLFHFQRRTHNE